MQVNFSKTKKLHKPIGRVQFHCLWKIYRCLLNEIAWDFMLLLIQNFHERSIIESQDRQNFDSCTCTICNLCLFYNLMLVLQLCTCGTWKMHLFSANQKHNFFMFIIILKCCWSNLDIQAFGDVSLHPSLFFFFTVTKPF